VLTNQAAARALPSLRMSCPPLHRRLLAPFVRELAPRGEIPSFASGPTVRAERGRRLAALP
jgi:hypothetical protein